MFKIQTKNKISQIGLNQFDSNFIIQDELQNPDGIILRSASLHEMTFSDNTKAIARAGAGVNNIPIDVCSQKGIVVFNTPGANANAVKELVICALFLASRKITQGISWEKTLTESDGEIGKQVEKGKSAFAGPEILGKTLGVIGLGAIGAKVALSAAGLGMKVIGYDEYLSDNRKAELSEAITISASIDDLFKNCDYITLHIPFTSTTANFINKDNIAKMKDGVRILNFARGELVNSNDIIDAVNSSKVASYITDFANEDQLKLDNIICLPHLGASTPESEDNCAVMAVNELKDYLLNGNITNSVNYPNVSLNRSGKHRICILSNSDVLSSVNDILVQDELISFVTKNKNGNHYSIVDCNVYPSQETLNIIKEIPGVVRINIL